MTNKLELSGIDLIQAAVWYARQLTGIESEITNFDIAFVPNNDDPTGMTFTLTVSFIEEETDNG